METDDISAMVGGAVKSTTTASSTRNKSQDLLLADSGEGSGGVGNGQLTTTVGKKIALNREVSSVKQNLISDKSNNKQAKTTIENASRKAGVRTEESVTLIFDRNKSKLFSLYNRARRKNPNLKGKIILEITIAPSGKVSKIIIVSSELNDKSLESGLLKRIKRFNFGAQPVEQVTVSYPIDFLPS